MKFRVNKIENAFLVDITDDDYDVKEFAYYSLEDVVTKLEEIFKQDGK